MDERELNDLLGTAEEPVAPPASVSERAQREMLDELRRTHVSHDAASIGTEVLVLDEVRPTTDRAQRRRWFRPLAVAVVVVAVVGLAVGLQRGDERSPVTTAPQQSFLRACVDFQNATTIDGQRWSVVLRDRDVDGPAQRAYLDELANALEDLARVSRAEAARPLLLEAASLAMAPVPDSTQLIEVLNDARLALTQNTGSPCITGR